MKVIVLNDRAEPIWERTNADGHQSGMTSLSYLQDGTQDRIIKVLEEALMQARGQASLPDDRDAVSDSGLSATEIDNHVPKATDRNGYACREVGEEPAFVPESPPAFVGTEISVVQKQEVASVTALQNSDVPD